MRKIEIPINDNQKITGTLYFPETMKEKNPAILFLHGWTSDETGYQPRAEALTKLGSMCLAINLRGHGTSSGKLEDFSRADHIDDVLHAYDFLAQQEVDANHISVVGASYGAYLASVLAGKRAVDNLVLRAPALYTNTDMTMPTAQFIEEHGIEFLKTITPEKDNLALEGITKITGKLLIIESEKDQIIPHTIIELYKQAAKPPVVHKIIHFSDHQLSKGEWKAQFIAILASFFAKNR